MKSTIGLRVGGEDFPLSVHTFSGGEVQVKVENPWQIISQDEIITISVKLRCAEGIQALTQLKAIVDHYTMTQQVHLEMFYAAYSRQDRICVDGESLAAKVFATQINAMGFDKIITSDNHSEVITALLDRSYNVTKVTLFDFCDNFAADYDVFVAPDFGASKEVQDLAREYGKEFVQGTKKRDPKTGALSGFGCYAPESSLDGKKVLIIDDLCDGGGTFIGLAEEMEFWHDMKSISLYVTHGIFSKGTKLLTDTFDHVYTTDSIVDDTDVFDAENFTVFSPL